MAIRGRFIDGPLDGQWKALQDPLTEIRVARAVKVTDLEPLNEEAFVTPVQGTYKLFNVTTVEMIGQGTYYWQGWDDEVREMQKDGRD